MPVIWRSPRNSKVKLCMYPDHAPPHFHLYGPGWSAVVDLATLTVRRGRAPRVELAEALQWAQSNMPLLTAQWTKLNERD
jgi:hypothetical protein